MHTLLSIAQNGLGLPGAGPVTVLHVSRFGRRAHFVVVDRQSDDWLHHGQAKKRPRPGHRDAQNEEEFKKIAPPCAMHAQQQVGLQHSVGERVAGLRLLLLPQSFFREKMLQHVGRSPWGLFQECKASGQVRDCMIEQTNGGQSKRTDR